MSPILFNYQIEGSYVSFDPFIKTRSTCGYLITHVVNKIVDLVMKSARFSQSVRPLYYHPQQKSTAF